MSDDAKTQSAKPRGGSLPLVAWLFFPAALLVRALPWPSVVGRDGRVLPFGNDAYYHLRRIAYSVENFPAALDVDPYLNFPEGGQAIWTPVLDWGLALIARFAVGPGDPHALERLLVWAPPVIGALTVVAVFALGRRHFPARVGPIAAALLCLLPAHFWYSQLGFIDHHVAVALATTALLWTGLSLLGSESPVLRRAVALGVAMAACLLVWPGTLLHVGIVELALGLRVLTARGDDAAVAWARAFALSHAVACVLLIPFCVGNEWLRWGEYSPVVLSRFQPLWFASAGAGFGLFGGLGRRGWIGASPRDRSLSALALAAVVLGVAVAAVPNLSGGIAESWRWFSRSESFQANVGESLPLFERGAGRAAELFTGLVFATPLLWFQGVRLARRAPAPAAAWLFLGWCVLLFAATLGQRRFMNSYAVAWALLLAWCGHGLALEARERLRGRRPVAIAVAAASLVVAAIALAPVARSYAPHVENGRRLLRGEPIQRHYLGHLQGIRVETAEWLRDHTPATAGYFDAAVRPEYGVLAPWSSGHVLKYVARRPVVQDNFGDDVADRNFDLAKRYYAATDESDALSIVRDLRVRYVMARLEDAVQLRSHDTASLYIRLNLQRGAERMVRRHPDGPLVRVPALSRHRLLFESAPLSGTRGEAPSLFKLYEIVAGARLVGRALPGERVEARLAVQPRGAAPFVYRNSTRADAAGRWELVLPYPTEDFGAAVDVGARYLLQSGDQRAELAISEVAVRSGSRITAPDLLRSAVPGAASTDSDESE